MLYRLDKAILRIKINDMNLLYIQSTDHGCLQSLAFVQPLVQEAPLHMRTYEAHQECTAKAPGDDDALALVRVHNEICRWQPHRNQVLPKCLSINNSKVTCTGGMKGRTFIR